MRKPAICSLTLLLLAANAHSQPLSYMPTSPSVFSATTVNDYLAACQANRTACIDEVGSAMMDKFDYAGDLCLNSVDYANAVPEWLGAHTETHTMPTADGIYLALKSLYKCD